MSLRKQVLIALLIGLLLGVVVMVLAGSAGAAQALWWQSEAQWSCRESNPGGSGGAAARVR